MSKRIRLLPGIIKTCTICDDSFSPKSWNSINCSEPCRRIYTRSQSQLTYQADPAAAAAYKREYNQKNHKVVEARKKAWAQANIEKVRAYNRAAYHRNPGSSYRSVRKRQAAIFGAPLGSGLPWPTLPEILAEYDGLCWSCGKSADRWEIDHLIPLSRGGCHALENAALSCRFCNRSKHNKLTTEDIAEYLRRCVLLNVDPCEVPLAA